MATVSEMCSVLTIILDKKNTIPSKNKLNVRFVSPISVWGSLVGGVLFLKTCCKKSLKQMLLDRYPVIRFMMIKNTGYGLLLIVCL